MRDRRKAKGELLRKVTVKIGLKRINTQERITVEALLDSDSKATELVMSSEFTKKQRFRLKKIERPIYIVVINIGDRYQSQSIFRMTNTV